MNLSARPVVIRTATLFRLKPLARALSSIAGLLPAVVWAQMPTNGTVAAGAAVINQTDANHMLVQQTSSKAVLNWQQFSIGQQGYVQFIQPNASAIALNRVVGADPSAILGHLSANGQIFLINPNGIMFGVGSRVDVAGLVATTLNISDDDFLKGDYRFQRAPERTDGAMVVNAGTIDTAAGGYVVLAGDYVKNEGVIQAPAGTALLASGKALTLQLSGSNLIDFAVDEAAVVELAGVENAGQILANGGRVIMTAKVANDLAATVVNNTGLVQAQSTVEKGGVIYLVGEGGSVANAGTLDASAQTGADGGAIAIRASGDVIHQTGSRATVSGADSQNSNAGELYSWADGTNRYQQGARIEARGGADGGDGGQVEISGRHVAVQEIVDLRAPHGKLGTLALDPNYIYVSADGTNAGATGTPDSVIAEAVLEGQLKVGNVQHTATGADAQIVFGTLSDGVLDGTNNGSGGSLTLLASGSGAPAIAMNTNDTLRVDGALTFSVNDGVNPAGTMTLGHLEAGTSITLDAGSIATGNLSINKTINTSTDTAYTIAARAHTGDLTVNGDVLVNVTNSTAAAVATGVTLRADAGSINVSGDVISNATGKGYYHYNWQTAGSDAETYFGNQPWTLANQGDHPIGATLNILAGNNVLVGGAVDVRAIDNNTTFAGNGGYFETATTTQHNFWRATAADATATIQAGGNVGIGGLTSVIADGYANSSYGEIESYDTMVSNYNFATGNQTVFTNYQCNPGCGYTSSYNYQRNDMKGSFAGNYVWSFGPYTYSLPGTAYNSPSYSQTTDSNPNSHAGPMAYTGQAGLTAALNINAGGNVVLNGLDTEAINRSVTAAGGFTDINWGTQDTSGAGLSLSGSIERRYSDNFTTSFTAAPATATASITAGDNQSVQLNGGLGVEYHVEALHIGINAANNTLAFAAMTVAAGSAGNPTGSGAVNIDGPVTVIGASNVEIGLTVINSDGAINNSDPNAGTIAVTNQYSGGDARAAFTGAGAIDLGTVTVDAGANAAFDATGGALVNIGNSAVTAGQMGDFNVDSVGAISLGAVVVNAGHTGTVDIIGGDAINLAGITIVAGHTANLTAHAAQDLLISAALSATAPRFANVDLAATAGAIHVTDQGSVNATAAGSGYDGGMVYWNGVANVDVNDAGPMSLEGNVIASARGTAAVTIGSSGAIGVGTDAAVRALSQESSAAVTIAATSGLQLDGDVLAQAGQGAAAATLTTSGGSNAAIGQHSASTVAVTGISTALTVKAGNATVLNAGNAAVLDLLGTLQSTATTGAATLAVGGASGTINNFSAVSGSNTASATINSYDADATLSLAGTGTVTANNNGVTGAQLLVTAAGNLAAEQAILQVQNNNAGSSAGARAILAADGSNKIGDLSVATNGGGNIILQATGGGAVTASGELKATAHAGMASIELTSSAAKTEITSQGSASAVSDSNTATVVITGATDAIIGGAVAAQSTTNAASVQLFATMGSVNIADGVGIDVTSTTNTASLLVNGAVGIDFAGDSQVNAGGTLTSIDLTSAGAIQIGGVMGATASTGKAAIIVGSGALLSIGSDGDLQAIAGGTEAKVTLTGTTGLQIDGDVLAQASNGDALVALTTLGGATAAISQASNSSIAATGQFAQLTVKAGSNALDSTNAAALTLAGALAASSGSNAAVLTIEGAGGSVHDFSVISTTNSATATITSYDAGGLLTLNGAGIVTGNLNAASGAVLNVTAAGALNAQLATLTIANNNVSSAAGATADLNADDALVLGVFNVATAGGGDVVITGSGTTLTVNEAMTANSTSGDALINLTASSGVLTTLVDGDISASTQSGAAQLLFDGASGISAAGDLSAMVAQTGANASIALDSNGDIAVSGAIVANAIDAATVAIHGANIHIDQLGSVSAISALQNSWIDVLASSGLIIDGNLAASSNAGDATIDLISSGGVSAAITQGANSTINATGKNAALTLQAGSSGMIDITQAAAVNLAGTLSLHATNGDAELSIEGAGGSIHNFAASADAGFASAKIQMYDDAAGLMLDGIGSITASANSADGAALSISAAGSLDASAATLAVDNSNVGTDGGATALLTAGNGRNDLGTLSINNLGGGLAEIIASASNGLSAADLSATGGTANVELTAVHGALDLGAVVATGAAGATINATAQQGSLTQLVSSNLVADAANGVALIDLMASDNIVLRDVTAAGVSAALTATAQNGAFADIANTALHAAAGNGTAVLQLTSSAPMTIDGNVFADSTGNTATLTVNSANATLAQGQQSLIRATGIDAATTIHAGVMTLDGTLQALSTAGAANLAVSGGAGSIHNFRAASDAGLASATIVSSGALVLNGNGSVSGHQNGAAGAVLAVNAAALDSRTAVLLVENTDTGAASGAMATLAASLGSAQIGSLSVANSGAGTASIIASGQTGLTVSELMATGGIASIDLTAATGAVELGNVIATGAMDAALSATAQTGALNQLANTTLQVTAGGAATAQLMGAGPLVIDGDIFVASTGNSAAVTLTGGGTITQGVDSLIRSSGADATTTVTAAGMMALNGNLQALASSTATLNIDGGAGSIHDFSAISSAGAAHAQIVSGGALALNGSGGVTANHNSADGATLTVDAAGNLDTRLATLTASNQHSGDQAGTLLSLTSGGDLNSGAIAVDATGGQAAQLKLHAGGALYVENNLFADAFNSGSGFGSASIILSSGDHAGTASSIIQNAGSAIRASSNGNEAGAASVLIAAGNCCDSSVQLLGSTLAEVFSGLGQASITVHGATVAVPNLVARNSGGGDSLIDLAAPSALTVNGVLTAQAAAPTAQAGIKLITDELNYLGGNAVLSQGNGHVQLAPFNTTYLIGVDSKPDFDSTPLMNYNIALLQKFTRNGAEIKFGGAYDRTPWLDAEGKACVAGMDGWDDIGQQTGSIHVAGAGIGNLRLAATTMVFDTSGTTYYHDNQMTPWSVPTGRVAIYVPQPIASLDRYLDRTENTLQQLIGGLEDIGAMPLYEAESLPVPDGTVQIAGNMFMAGDGVNMDRIMDGTAPGSSSGSSNNMFNDSAAPAESNSQNGVEIDDNEKRRHKIQVR